MEPFASVSNLAKLSVDIPLGLQEKGNDVRCLMPKYGFISERKYILREVIRLKEILFDFDDSTYMCSAKSAFLPKSRLQVYFLENKEQFDDLKTTTFPIFSYQKSLDKVQTNNISSVQLGTFSDDFFGRTNSSFVSQLDVFSLQTFGDFNQDQENEGSLTDIRVINEEEQLTGVYLDLPFFNNTNWSIRKMFFFIINKTCLLYTSDAADE